MQFFQFEISGLGIGQRERRKEVQSQHWNGKCLEANARYAVADQVKINSTACFYLAMIIMINENIFFKSKVRCLR